MTSKEAIMTWRALVAIALLGAVASPASAVSPPAMKRTITHDGDRIAAMPVNDGTVAPDRVVGKVLAIDPQHGSFLLGTDAGMIALRADPQISPGCTSARPSKSRWSMTSRLTIRLRPGDS
jgi:hypothetical protein